MGLLLFLFSVVSTKGQTTATLVPKKGLHVTTGGLNWLTGSEINLYAQDKKNHHYFFSWWEQDAYVSKSGNERLFIGSSNTAVKGVYLLEQEGKKIRTFFDCKWNLQNHGLADIIYAKIWLPYFSEASFSTDTNSNITDLKNFYDNKLTVKTNFGIFKFSSSHPFKVKTDANLRPGHYDYTRRAQYLVFYEENIPVTDSSMLNRAFQIETTDEMKESSPCSEVLKVKPEKIAVAWQPHSQQTTLLPQPKEIEYHQDAYLIPLKKRQPLSMTVTAFRELLKIQWKLGDNYFPVIQAKENKSLNKEGYFVEVNKKGVNIQYHSPAGLQHALQTLAQLVKNENGHLVIPIVKINDWPSVYWRGIHMFTGPSSWPLHRRMYDRILFPLKMNKVVLQCEQAKWKCRPELHNSISVPMKDLKAEFEYLRKNNNEPIPLIQSLGHMEWFFKPKENRWMAVNPEYPYTINPDLSAAKTAIKQIWDEVFELLQPKTMHIGFDEIGMIGFHLPREKEIDYFKTQIGFLQQYSISKNAKLMLWGDMGLGPGEGPDALNGVTKERAATIRSFIPRRAYVADWHYINNADPEVYKPNLRIWKKNQNIPLASPWLWPNNVNGFVKAAIDENAGVLQTTWADFESSEKNMLLNIEQFGAYILAMDYAWSGRNELPEQLPYHATEEWIKRFYSQPKPVTQKAGFSIPLQIQLKNISKKSTSLSPDTVSFHTGEIYSTGFSLQSATETILAEGTPVAEIIFLNGNKTVYKKQIRYGVEVRAVSDNRQVYAADTHEKEQVFDFFDTHLRFDKIVVINVHPASGFHIRKFVLVSK